MSNPKTPPDFFVIGAQKAGTTTLHDRLLKCHLVNLPVIKETHFFSDDEKYQRGLDWYFRQFPRDQSFTKRGEIAPDYLFSIQAPGRIRALTPKPDIIVIFRNPLERAYSHYLMAVRNGHENLSFHDALLAEQKSGTSPDPRSRSLHSYLGRSLYGEQLRRYLDTLPNARYLFLKFEDFTDEGEIGVRTYRRLCKFIGVPKCAAGTDITAKSNVASQPRFPLLRNLLYKPSTLKRVLRICIPSYDLRARIAQRLDLLNQRPIEKQPMGPIPGFVLTRLIDDLDLLQRLTQLDLQHWKVEMTASYRGK